MNGRISFGFIKLPIIVQPIIIKWLSDHVWIHYLLHFFICPFKNPINKKPHKFYRPIDFIKLYKVDMYDGVVSE